MRKPRNSSQYASSVAATSQNSSSVASASQNSSSVATASFLVSNLIPQKDVAMTSTGPVVYSNTIERHDAKLSQSSDFIPVTSDTSKIKLPSPTHALASPTPDMFSRISSKSSPKLLRNTRKNAPLTLRQLKSNSRSVKSNFRPLKNSCSMKSNFHAVKSRNMDYALHLSSQQILTDVLPVQTDSGAVEEAPCEVKQEDIEAISSRHHEEPPEYTAIDSQTMCIFNTQNMQVCSFSRFIFYAQYAQLCIVLYRFVYKLSMLRICSFVGFS